MASLTTDIETHVETRYGEPRQPLILRILTRLGAGGPPIHVVAVNREMRRRGYAAALATGACDSQDGDMSYLLDAGDQVYWIQRMSRAVNPAADLAALWKLWRLMRRLKPAIVHTHTAKAGVLGRIAARLAGVPVVVHTYHGNVFREYFSPPVSALVRQVERCLAVLTDAICVLSPQQATEITSTYSIAPKQKTHVIPLGLELEPFTQLPLPPRKPGWLTAGWLGRLVPVKNVPLLVAVMEATLRRTDRVRFLIAGDGPERETVRRAAHALGEDRVTFLGWRRDVRPVIEACDVLIQTSRNEGTPTALIQGMAAGRPFVSTPVGGVVDMVDGIPRRRQDSTRWHGNGVLVNPEPRAFARVLEELSRRRRLARTMGEQARRFAMPRYRFGVLIRNLDLLYSDLLARKVPLSTVPRPAAVGGGS